MIKNVKNLVKLQDNLRKKVTLRSFGLRPPSLRLRKLIMEKCAKILKTLQIERKSLNEKQMFFGVENSYMVMTTLLNA